MRQEAGDSEGRLPLCISRRASRLHDVKIIKRMLEHSSRRRFLKESVSGLLCASVSPRSFVSALQQNIAGLKTDTPAVALIADLTSSIPASMRRHNVPGLSIAIIRDERVLWTQGFGVKNITTREPVIADTVFEAASLSKPAFAYVVLRLCEQNRIGLDTPLVEYSPQSLIANEPRMNRITARHVLAHTSGLPHSRRRGRPLALLFAPGERFNYSPLGYQWLQMVVERVTNEPFTALMKRRLLDPFGMSDSSFEWLARYERTTAHGHNEDGEVEPSEMGRFRQYTAEERQTIYGDIPEARYFGAAAGLYTTAADYAKFMIEIIQPARTSGLHLSAILTTEMLRSQIRITDAVSWSLGWGIERTNAADAFWHWGDWGVFRNFAVAFKPQRIGVVILTNSFYGPRVYREVVPQAIGGIHPALTWIES